MQHLLPLTNQQGTFPCLKVLAETCSQGAGVAGTAVPPSPTRRAGDNVPDSRQAEAPSQWWPDHHHQKLFKISAEASGWKIMAFCWANAGPGGGTQRQLCWCGLSALLALSGCSYWRWICLNALPTPSTLERVCDCSNQQHKSHLDPVGRWCRQPQAATTLQYPGFSPDAFGWENAFDQQPCGIDLNQG